MSHNKRAHREYLRTFFAYLLLILFVATYSYFMNGVLYRERKASNDNYQEFIKVIGLKEAKIIELEKRVVELTPKKVVKKRVLPIRTCK